MLTEAGKALTGATPARLRTFPAEQSPAVADGAANGVARESDTPVWDAEHRQLRVREQVVKRDKVPCPGQESILAAFQEEGWPPGNRRPPAAAPGAGPKGRIRNTIQNLNANQRSL